MSLDPSRGHVHNNPCVAALPQLDRGSDYESERHRFESYTPHHLRLKLPATGAFLLRKHRMDSNLGRGAGVKKTRSVFSPRASTPAGGRSRCGSAQRMRGILYAAPFEIKAPGNGGFSFQDFSLLAAQRPALNHPLRGWRQTALQSHPSDRY